MLNPRKAAVSALIKVDSDSAFSNIVLNNILSENEFSKEDKALISAVFYGVLDRRITIDYVLSRYVKTPLKKLPFYTLNVLRSGLYQIMYMNRIPDSAAVNESVKLIKKSGESRNAGFVNAVLRNILRDGVELPKGDSIKDMSIRYSCPEWIVESFVSDYGTEDAKAILEESLKAAPLTVRANTLKISAEELAKEFSNQGISAEIEKSGNSISIKNGINIKNNSLYKSGMFYAQDTASQTVVSVLAPKAGNRVLDMCSAPGGKSFTMAQLMQNNGEIISCDIFEQRVDLIRSDAKRLGIDIIRPVKADACEYNGEFGSFDCVLCDVPCSGLGVLRRKPDIKYNKSNDFTALEKTQRAILENAAKYLRHGGKLLYSTCTLRKNENEKNIENFLAKHSDFSLDYEHTFMTHKDGTDGFFCALLIKNK